MTISNTASSVTVLGNGTQTTFNYGFLIPVGSNFALYYEDASGNVTTLDPSVYAVNGVGNATGGTFEYPLGGGTPIAAGTSLTLTREVPDQQQTSLGNQGAYYPAVVEGALDWIVMQIQDLAGKVGRSILGSPVDGALPALASAKQRANTYLAFDSNGNPIASPGGSGTVPISTAMQPVVEAASTDAALEGMGVSSAVLPVIKEVTTDGALEALGVSASMLSVVKAATTLESLGEQGAGVPVSDAAALRAATAASLPGSLVYLRGYAQAGGGGAGVFQYDSTDSASADNKGTIIVDASGRRWKRSFSGAVNVRWFGAKGDGATDDTAAIQAAVNYTLGVANGGAVYLPTGVYIVSSTITAPNSQNVSLRIFGDGKPSQIKYSGASTVKLFNCGSSTATFGSEYIFEDICFAQPAGGSVSSIYLQNVNGAKIRRVFFYNQNTGVLLDSSYSVTFTECLFYAAVADAITTINTGTNNLIIDKCQFSTCGTALNIIGGGHNIVVRDSDFESNTLAMGITNYTSVLFEGNYVEGQTNAYLFFGGTNYSVDIRQNWFGANTVTSPIGNISGGSFTGNTLYNCAWGFSSTAIDVDCGENYIFGSATLGASPFNTVSSFLNSWTQGSTQVGYKKRSDGAVEIRGQLINGGNAGATAFVLPAEYRPPQNLTFAVTSQGTYGLGSCVVGANGNVVPNFAGGSTGSYVNLDGITFTAAN